jgi:hypothetical protein
MGEHAKEQDQIPCPLRRIPVLHPSLAHEYIARMLKPGTATPHHPRTRIKGHDAAFRAHPLGQMLRQRTRSAARLQNPATGQISKPLSQALDLRQVPSREQERVFTHRHPIEIARSRHLAHLVIKD